MTPTATDLIRRAAERERFAPDKQGLRNYAKYLRTQGIRMKAAVGAPTTEDDGFEDVAGVAAAAAFQSDIARFLVPAAIEPVPVKFDTRSPVLSAADAKWVPEGHANAVTSFSAGYVKVGQAKATATAVVPKELLASSGAISDQALLSLVRSPVVARVNATFLSADAAVAGESPAGIANGVTAIEATGTTAAAISTDLNSVIAAADAAGADLTRVVWVLSPAKAAFYASVLNLQNLGLRGGELVGAPAVTSPEAGEDVYLLDPSRIGVAMGEIEVRVTDQAVVEMNDAPTHDGTTPTAVQMVSLWQTNSVGYLARLWISWEALEGAVQVLSPAA